ncbi:50S ribosomal protein L29 [Aquirufa sp. ROCK2-A2]
MKNAEINKLGVEELVKQIASEKETLDRLNLAHAISPIENPMRIRQTRRLIARLETALTAQAKA